MKSTAAPTFASRAGGITPAPAASRPLRRDGTWSVAAATSLPVQRSPIDPKGTPLAPSFTAPLAQHQQQRLDALVQANDQSHVFEHVGALDEYLDKGDEQGMKTLDVEPSDYVAKLATAKDRARKRRALAPLKLRTTAHKSMVSDNPAFQDLTADQLPPLPEGNFLYRSEKHGVWKRRATPAAGDDWRMALYQKTAGAPVAYNMAHGGYLQRTLFQYGQGVKSKKRTREMAGLGSPGATPKWNDPSIGRAGKKRKLNNMKSLAVIQGHGQDFEETMPWKGDYDATHNTANKTLTKGAVKIVDSDTHPLNFSGEHPTYGQNFRNMILREAREDDEKGSIVEDTTYHNATIPVAVPTGFQPVKLPASKSLATLDRAGAPRKRYVVPQMESKPGGGGHRYVDLAAIAEAHRGKNPGQAGMHDLAAVTLQATPSPGSRSHVPTEPAPAGINAWLQSATDTPAIRQQLLRKKTFYHLKAKDFA
jgi:hypothetical protein